MSNDFHQYLARQCAVGREKFGPGERRKGVQEHILQEFDEIDKAETKQEAADEWVDVAILSLDGLMRAVREGLREQLKDAPEGPNYDNNGQLIGFNGEPTNDCVAGITMNLIVAKQHKNELRDFGDWRGVSEDEAINHKEGIHD